MTALARRRRRNTMLALVAGLVAAVAAPTLLYVGAKAISNSTAGINALEDVPLEQSFPQTPTAMLATVSDTNELTSVTVFVLAPDSDVTAAGYDQRGGSVVPVPINVDSGSGDQRLSLHDAYALGGEEELRADLESAISLTIEFSAVMTGDEFNTFLTGLPPVEVNLPVDVLGVDDVGVVPEGRRIALDSPAHTDPHDEVADAARTVTTSQHRCRVGGHRGDHRYRSRRTDSQPPAPRRPLRSWPARLTSGPMASRGLVARPLADDVNPEGLDVETLDRPDTILVFASIAPASMTRPASGLTYRLEAPSGYDQQVRKTIGILLSFGGNVVSVDLNAESSEDTTFLVYDKLLADVEPTDNPIFGTDLDRDARCETRQRRRNHCAGHQVPRPG